MEPSILKSVKKNLGIPPDYTAFDEDVLTHINTAFSILTQLGIGPDDGFMIEDDTTVWTDYVTTDVPANWLNSVRSYIYLKVRSYFDPPSASFHVSAMNEQIAELESRLNTSREFALYPEE